MPRVPDLPGQQIPYRSDQENWLKQHVARLCHLEHERFPGSQPVSFSTKDLDKLETQDYWVTEKSDGVRVLLLVQTDLETNFQAVYLIDRHNTYYQQDGLFFPHYDDPRRPLRNTLLDGELVVDTDPHTKQETLRYLAFDCMVVDDQNVMSKTLDKRYGRLQEWLYKPYTQMTRDHPQVMETQPFQIKVKAVKFSYHADDIFAIDIPALQHGNDGLIYTCVSTPYIPGTDKNILKWKPPSENSVDFKLVLRFPASSTRPEKPDFFAKPIFELHVWTGDRGGASQYEPYDTMEVEDDEWDRLKTSGEQLDDRIVEVHWDPGNECWRMMRFRDDKPNGNHKSVVENVIKSIADGVEKDTLLARSTTIRNAWKARNPQPPQRPSNSSHHPLPPRPPPPQYPQHHLPPPPPSLPTRPTSSNRMHPPPPDVEARYGPLAPSPYSKVAGPQIVAGMYR